MEKERRSPLREMSDEEKKKFIGDAIDGWLERKYAAFGKWTLRGIGATIFSAVVYFASTHPDFFRFIRGE